MSTRPVISESPSTGIREEIASQIGIYQIVQPYSYHMRGLLDDELILYALGQCPPKADEWQPET